jgi:hypothetical protein
MPSGSARAKAHAVRQIPLAVPVDRHAHARTNGAAHGRELVKAPGGVELRAIIAGKINNARALCHVFGQNPPFYELHKASQVLYIG